MQIPVTIVQSGGGAMTQLYDNTASGAIASWDVSGISQAYNHLMVFLAGRGDSAVTSVVARLTFNNDSGANYQWQLMNGQAATVGAASGVAQTFSQLGYLCGASSAANEPGAIHVKIPDYTGTTFYKMTLSEWANVPSAGNTFIVGQVAGRWASTVAVNRITIAPEAGNFIAGSRLTIYGLL